MINSQNNQDDGNSLVSLFLAGISFLLAGGVVFTIPNRYRAEVNFRAKALSASGIVTDKHETSSCYGGAGIAPLSCPRKCDATIKFKSNNGKTIVFSDSCPSFIRENQIVPVLYVPNGEARISRGDSADSVVKNGLMIGLVFALPGIAFLYLFRIQQKENNL